MVHLVKVSRKRTGGGGAHWKVNMQSPGWQFPYQDGKGKKRDFEGPKACKGWDGRVSKEAGLDRRQGRVWQGKAELINDAQDGKEKLRR